MGPTQASGWSRATNGEDPLVVRLGKTRWRKLTVRAEKRAPTRGFGVPLPCAQVQAAAPRSSVRHHARGCTAQAGSLRALSSHPAAAARPALGGGRAAYPAPLIWADGEYGRVYCPGPSAGGAIHGWPACNAREGTHAQHYHQPLQLGAQTMTAVHVLPGTSLDVLCLLCPAYAASQHQLIT